MPPKAKFSKDEIIEKCLEIVKESGFKSLTARNLVATKVCNFISEDITSLLNEVFIGLITNIKTKDMKGN